jgi:hypothetical protein
MNVHVVRGRNVQKAPLLQFFWRESDFFFALSISYPEESQSSAPEYGGCTVPSDLHITSGSLNAQADSIGAWYGCYGQMYPHPVPGGTDEE